MYTREQKKKAIELLIKYDWSVVKVIRELGYPGRQTLYGWIYEYQRSGTVREHSDAYIQKRQEPSQAKQEAVSYYLEHGKSLAQTIRALGYPKRPVTLCKWINELAPGERRKYQRSAARKHVDTQDSSKPKTPLELGDDNPLVKEVSKRYSIEHAPLYYWRSHLQKDAIIARKRRRKAGNVTPEEKLKRVEEELAAKEALLKSANAEIEAKIKQIEELEFELDVRQATMEILKKDLGGDPNRLNNQEKTLVINALRDKWGLARLLKRFDIAKSSYEYQVKVLGSKAHTLSEELKERVRAAFERCQGVYGYRRLLTELNDGVSKSNRVGEWTLRKCLRALNLTAKRPQRRKKYSSYVGEVSVAPANTCLDDRGRHTFTSDAPNKLWITDITEFAIDAGKVYLSPIIDCFDGMPISWSIGTSPNAELANSSLLAACK